MLQSDRWRRRVVPALLGAVLLIAPLVAVGHVHAAGSPAPNTCFVCTAAEHGATEVPGVATLGTPAWRPVGRGLSTQLLVVRRPLAASPSRGPPASATPSPH